MRFTYNLAYQHRANRKRDSESDIRAKFKIIQFLYDRFGLFGLTGETVYIPNGRIRLPDITIPHRNTILELDGELHGSGDQISKRDKDEFRDQDYKDAGFHLIIINKESTNGYDLKEVEKVLIANGIKDEKQSSTTPTTN